MEGYIVSIHGIGSEMQGVGRLPDGRVVFVRGAIPGEKVRIALEKEAARYAVGQLIDIVEPSQERAQPFCPYFGRCGGCSCQHMDYPSTLRYKTQIVKDALSRIGGAADVPVKQAIGMDAPFAYRNKVEYSLDRECHLGFARQGSHSVIRIDSCPLSEKCIDKAARSIDPILPSLGADLSYVVFRSNSMGKCMITLCGRNAGSWKKLLGVLPENVVSLVFCRLKPKHAHALDGSIDLLWGDDTLEENLLGMEFSMSPQSFFQVNRQQAEKMMRMAADFSLGHTGIAADVYCGVGTFSLALAKFAPLTKVYGFEIVASAVENARVNAQRNRLEGRTAFFAGDASQIMPKVTSGKKLSLAVIDPPRSGADERILHALIESEAENILYVSCNPATLGRDIKLLGDSYAIGSVQPVDMFPWTGHCESVVKLIRSDINP